MGYLGMSIPFYCSNKKTLDQAPTADDIQRLGGLLTNGLFYLNNGIVAKSPSGACKASLNRDGQTNEWQGPEHLFVFMNERWIKFSQSGLYT
jgi:hypothetical protein